MKRSAALLFAVTSALLFGTYVAGEDARVEPAPDRRDEARKPRILFTSPRVVAYQLRRLSDQELVLVDRNTSDPKYVPVYEALLSRPGLAPQFRSEALKGLAVLNRTDHVAELIAGIKRLDLRSDNDSGDDGDGGDDTDVLLELGRRLTATSPGDLKPKRAVLEGVAAAGRHVLARRIAIAGIVLADGEITRAWDAASQDQRRLVDLIDALPMIPDPKLRDAFYPKIERLIAAASNNIVRNAAIRGISHIPGHDAKTFAMLAEVIRNDRGRQAAIVSIRRTDKTTWPADRIGPLTECLLGYAESVPVADRSSDVFLEAMALGNELADGLPEDKAASVRRQLRNMGVSVFLIKTIPHRMLYDRTKIEVEAGKSVLVIFENDDTMTHNLVIATPGAHEEIGTAAEAMAAQPDGLARSFVPDSEKILQATKLLQPGEVEKLSFNAPQEPGVYPYLCTYPGHWRRMFGAMYVVADLDRYQADPEAYLAEHRVKILDHLLKNKRTRTQWKFDDLAPSLEHLSHGRSFENGKQMFEVATCVACHRLSEVGHEIGPDLTKLDPKLAPSDILREMLDPSKKINEDFYTHTFVLDSGITVSGLIVEETDDVVQVVKDPSAESKPLVLEKAEIEDRAKSPLSIMPNGLLDQLTHDEILDLLAYVMARGDRDHKLFHGGHSD